jgi:hypothetical protein
MARGGIVALADGGETDPYARFNTLSGQSKDAYDYLMGNIQRVPAADLTTPTRPIVSNTNTVPTTGGGGDGGIGPVEPPATFFPPTYTEPVMPSPDEDFPSTYPEPVPADPRDFGAVDEPVTFAPADPRDFGAVDEPVTFAPADPRDFGAVDPEPAREPVDASYWSNPGQDEVGPSRGLMKNQEELPEEFDKYLQPEPSEFIPANPSDFGAVDGYDLSGSFDFRGGDSSGYGSDFAPANSSDFGGRNDAGYCPAPWINILLADGGTVKAGDIKPGMEVYTRHETTNEWGVYPVSAVEMSEDERWEVLLEDGRSFVGSPNHRVHTGEDWTEIHALKAGDKLVQPEGFGVVKSSAKLDHGAVVKITVADAHTYISEGFLSHNVKMISPSISDMDYSDYNNYDWDGWANGGMVPGYADGGVSGSGSLDLHVPINLGSGGGGGMGGGFNGGYTPAGSNGSAGNMNPNTGGGGLSGLAGLFGGQPAQQPYQPQHYGLEPMTQPFNPEPMEEPRRFIDDIFKDIGNGGVRANGGYNPFSAKLPEANFIDDRTDAQKAEAERFAAANPSVRGLATGGIAGYALGGLGALGGYSDGGRLLKGPGDGVSDSIPATIGKNKQPARLADGEFVVPARIVSELGNGSTEAGARKLYAMMDRIQKNRSKTVGKGKVAANSRSDKHLPA